MDKKDNIFGFERPPIILVGSGISKRYIKEYPDFKDLLNSIAERMGVNKHIFVAYSAAAKSNQDKQEMPQIASMLSERLISEIISEDIDPEVLFSPEELERYHEIRDPFKVLVSSEFDKMIIKDDSQSMKELELFKNLNGIIPCVITTNYDLFLEKEIFRGYKVYSRVSDYYFSEAQEIGDIYKIHGNMTYPSDIVITSEDYDNYRNNSKIISAKILSLLCDYPMIIMGYSMEDENVKSIISDLIHCLEKEKLNEIEKNIIFISFDEHESGMVRISMSFPSGNKRMAISGIKTNNFEKIFTEISKIRPTVPITTIRKLRTLVKEIVLTAEPIGRRVEMLGFDEIDDISSDKLVLALASKEMIKKWKSGVRYGLYTYTVDEMIKDIFSGNPRFKSEEIFEWFDSKPPNFTLNQFVPIFYFIRGLKLSREDLSDWTKKFIEEKNVQYTKKISDLEKINIKEGNPNLKSEDDLRSLFKGKEKNLPRPDIILYYYSKDIITEDEAKNLLRDYSGPNDKTSYRRAVTYLAFKDFKLR